MVSGKTNPNRHCLWQRFSLFSVNITKTVILTITALDYKIQQPSLKISQPIVSQFPSRQVNGLTNLVAKSNYSSDVLLYRTIIPYCQTDCCFSIFILLLRICCITIIIKCQQNCMPNGAVKAMY